MIDKRFLKFCQVAVFLLILCSAYSGLFVSKKNGDAYTTSDEQLNELKISLESTSKDLKAISWSIGGFRVKKSLSWTLNGAYFELSNCISYENFNKILSQNGFKKDPINGVYYCKKDIVLYGSFDSGENDYSKNEGAYCKKVIFNIKWENGQNKNLPFCWED